jgi:putative oxidoreductase
MKLGLTLLRVVIGGLFFGHGTQKLFGWFGGHGPVATGQFFESIGLQPGEKHARAAGAAEAGGGAALALGLATPAAAASLIGVMSTAIRKVHLANGPWVTEGGYEYPLALIATMVMFADLGPGDVSLDRALGIRVNGPLVALLALGAGIGGAAALTGSSSPATTAPAPATPAEGPSQPSAPESESIPGDPAPVA